MRCDFTTTSLAELRYYGVLFTDGDCNPVPTLYHYTASENINKICLDTHIELRFTRVDQFKDQHEAQHIIPVLRKLFAQCKEQGRIDDQFYQALVNALDETPVISEHLKQWYVFCVSKENNCQYLIDHYACRSEKPGCIIGLQYHKIEELIWDSQMTVYPAVHIYDVLYDETELTSYIRTLILRAYELRSQDDSSYTFCAVYRHFVRHGWIWRKATGATEKIT